MLEDLGPSNATWGDFHSLIQLSIGLNAAFGTFSDFLGDGLEREQRRIQRLLKRLDPVEGHNPLPKRPAELSEKAHLQILLGRCRIKQVRHDRFRSGFIRIGGFICAFLGCLVLVCATYAANRQISPIGELLVYLMFLPFIIGAGHGMYTSIEAYFSIVQKRELIESRLALHEQQMANQQYERESGDS